MNHVERSEPDIRLLGSNPNEYILRRPIQGIITLIYKSHKRGFLPLVGKLHQAMLHRIEMDVIDMVIEVLIIPDGMFPIAPLPDGRSCLFWREDDPFGSNSLGNCLLNSVLIKRQRVG